jgi:hypothetical protein
MTLQTGEVVLIRIDFHQTPGGKLRPAVVLLDSADDDFVAAPITSRARMSNFDVPIHQMPRSILGPPGNLWVSWVSKSVLAGGIESQRRLR